MLGGFAGISIVGVGVRLRACESFRRLVIFIPFVSMFLMNSEAFIMRERLLFDFTNRVFMNASMSDDDWV